MRWEKRSYVAVVGHGIDSSGAPEALRRLLSPRSVPSRCGATPSVKPAAPGSQPKCSPITHDSRTTALPSTDSQFHNVRPCAHRRLQCNTTSPFLPVSHNVSNTLAGSVLSPQLYVFTGQHMASRAVAAIGAAVRTPVARRRRRVGSITAVRAAVWRWRLDAVCPVGRRGAGGLRGGGRRACKHRASSAVNVRTMYPCPPGSKVSKPLKPIRGVARRRDALQVIMCTTNRHMCMQPWRPSAYRALARG
mgnify:CR=1 FL=1